GMLQFRRGPVRAIRHVIRPSVSFSYRPDFGSDKLGYFRTVQIDTLGNFRRYSIFGNDAAYSSVIGVPTDAKSGRLNFSINNNLEMKVKSKSDTITGMKKVMLIESFTINSSYDLARDSLKWSPLTLNARTTLFKKLQVQYNATFDPYIKDLKGKPINQFEWDLNNRLFRRDNSSWNFSLSYSFGSGKNKPAGSQTSVVVPAEEAEEIINQPENYINWNNPWNFSFSYNLRYNDLFDYINYTMEHKLIQTLQFNGDVNITPKWKVNFTSGYDFEQSKLSYTSVSVYRDLHCWEMRFNWIPMGIQKSWNFNIKVKASILQDLKLNRKKDFRDNL
ncbi:MAG: putative LPS assembly protein LptD, partial [Chloroflexota bacterium]